jgi:ribosome-binding protein aMBF1 (putative translation factor)
MTPAQCRTARAILGWSQADLAKASITVPEGVIADFENGAWIRAVDLVAIKDALERAGIEISEGRVRLRKDRP